MRKARAAAVSLAGLVLLSSLGARSRANSPLTDGYATVKLADGIFAFVAPDVMGAIVNGNTTLIVGDSAAMVVDAGHFPTLTRRMIADIRRITNKPVRYLVNTHWHPDHWMGNAEFRAAYPSIEIISTEATRDAMVREGPKFIKQYRDTSTLFQLRALAKPPAHADTTRTGRATREYYAATLPDVTGALESWKDARIELPNLTTEHDLQLHLGQRDVRVMFLGRGNTSGDLVVYVPGDRIIATGDLLVAPIPYGFGSFFDDWIGVLHSIRDLHPAIIVPGHGAVERDTSYLSLVTDFLTAVRDSAEASVRRGSTPEQAAKIDLSSFEGRFTHSDPQLRNLFYLDWQVAGLRRAYEEARVRLER
jgi:cyclase